MNAGAAAVQGDVLLFLHADTELEAGALRAVERALEHPRRLGGCFCLRFHEAAQSWALRLWGWTTRCRFLQRPRLVFGDRAIFARSWAFEAVGRFQEIPLLEDPDFALQLSKFGGGPHCFAFLEESVCTSGRRMLEKGPIRQQLQNCYIMALWHLGYSPAQLRDMYRYKPPPGSSQV